MRGAKAAEAEGGRPSSKRPERDCCRGSAVSLMRYVFGSSADFTRSQCCVHMPAHRFQSFFVFVTRSR